MPSALHDLDVPANPQATAARCVTLRINALDAFAKYLAIWNVSNRFCSPARCFVFKHDSLKSLNLNILKLLLRPYVFKYSLSLPAKDVGIARGDGLNQEIDGETRLEKIKNVSTNFNDVAQPWF